MRDENSVHVEEKDLHPTRSVLASAPSGVDSLDVGRFTSRAHLRSRGAGGALEIFLYAHAFYSLR